METEDMEATAMRERQKQEEKKVSNAEEDRFEIGRDGYAALAALSISSGHFFGPDLRGSQN